MDFKRFPEDGKTVTKTREEVAQVSGMVRDYIKVNNSLPTLITFNDGTKVNQATFLRMMCVAIAQLQTGDTTPILTTPYNNPSQGADNVTSGKQWSRKDYTNFAYDTKEHYAVYKTCPTMHGTPFGELSFYGIIWTLSRVLGWYWDNPDKLPVRTLPAYVVVENKFKAVNTTPTVTKSQFHQAVEGVTGAYSTFTEYYNWIKNNSSWDGYYNDIYDQYTELTRLRDKLPLNCTDHSQIGHAVLSDLGYEVRYMKVECKSGGHIYLQARGKELGSNWIDIDLAAAANSQYSLGSRWCSYATGYSIEGYEWVMSDNGIT